MSKTKKLEIEDPHSDGDSLSRNLRTKDFKLGCIHGRLIADKSGSEADIQRNIFLTQRLRIKGENPRVIRLFGYEIPIEYRRGKSRGQCVDLMGYDAGHDFLYLIELKAGESEQKIDKIVTQINDYALGVQGSLAKISEEFIEKFLFPINFSSIKKMIIAPKKFWEFYDDKKYLLKDKTIDYGFFSNDITKPKEIIDISLLE